jgi:NADH-quinone oxidoreductase subunit J
LSSGYLLPFEIVSVHLLVVLIGAAYLARTKRRVDSATRVGANGPART